MKFLVPTLIIIIVFLTAGLSYFLGKSSGAKQKQAASTIITPSVEPTAANTQTPSPSVKKTTGGGILSFPSYIIVSPLDWTETREAQGKDSEKIILTKGAYQISITQGGFGGSACLFPGDADIEGPSARYDNFKELTTQSGDKMRRSWTAEELKSKGFGICQLTQYGWQAPTLYGHISFITPSSPDPVILAQMDSILVSLTKK